jgi:hypothetical protein
MSDMRQAASPAYAQMLAISPGKRFNREIGIPLLSGLGLTGAATLLKN